jgi:hypothetical protein
VVSDRFYLNPTQIKLPHEIQQLCHSQPPFNYHFAPTSLKIRGFCDICFNIDRFGYNWIWSPNLWQPLDLVPKSIKHCCTSYIKSFRSSAIKNMSLQSLACTCVGFCLHLPMPPSNLIQVT